MAQFMNADRAFALQDQNLLLMAEDSETLNDMLERGMGKNSLRAIEADLRYFRAWALASTKSPLPPSPPLDLVLKFVAQHFWTDTGHDNSGNRGMPTAVMEILQEAGYFKSGKPHATSTLRRRMSTWRTVCVWNERDHPFDDQRLKKVLRLSGRSRAVRRGRHSKKAITRDIVLRMIKATSAYCTPSFDAVVDDPAERLVAFRDRALLAFAFASGGRRRSEVSDLTLEMIEEMPDTSRFDAGLDQNLTADRIPVLQIFMGRTKTTDDEDDFSVYLTGDPVRWLKSWITQAHITSGPVFRSVDRWGNVSTVGLTPAGVNLIVKKRIAEIDEDPSEYSAHGLRSGYLTTAGIDGVALSSAMAQSGHRSSVQAMAYFNEGSRGHGKAAQLLDP